MRSQSILVSAAIAVLAILCPVREVMAQVPASGLRPQRAQRVQIPQIEVASPDGKLKFTVLANAERLTYTVTSGSATVIEPSPIVMKVDGYDLSSGVDFVNVERYQLDEKYPWYGAHSTATNRCNGAKISLVHDLSFVPYVLDVRVFNDGIAFRHVVPEEQGSSHVPDEYSNFVIPSGSTVWYGSLEGHYETEYSKKDISEIRAGEWSGPPLTFKLPGGVYASITEANLVNYSGMALEADGRRGWTIGLGHRQPISHPYELRYGRDEAKRLATPASVTGTITTPWRVVMVGDLNTLVNSTILPNLCPPPDPKIFPDGIKTSWIKPGRAVWRYLDGGPDGLDGIKQFSRMAGELGFEHQVVEGIWNRWSMQERREAVDYSRERGVSLWFWQFSKELHTPESQEEFFTMLHDLGVAGAKIDFFDHEAKEVVDLYESLLQKAAEYHIMLCFHGANKPTGRMRTWPNEMVREGIRGMEASRLTQRARHQTILPFTRYLAGPADYTTMVFSDRRADSSVAHQIATTVVYAAPLLTIAGNPESILSSPAVNVIKSVPATWDETVVFPQSEIGELAVYARRSGNTWFLAVMCGPQPKHIDIPLGFLGEGRYKADFIRDANSDGSTVAVESADKKQTDMITLDLQAGGGFLARFTRQ